MQIIMHVLYIPVVKFLLCSLFPHKFKAFLGLFLLLLNANQWNYKSLAMHCKENSEG